MPNFVSTSTPAASGPQAMNLLALKQRLAEQQAQQAAISRPHVVTSPMQGLGDLANAFFTARRGDYLQQQDANTRDTLAKMRAGWDPAGPTPAQAAAYSQLDPEEGNRVADQVMQAKQAAATADTLFGHQQTLQTQAEGATSGLEKQRETYETGKTAIYKPMDPADIAAQHLPAGARVDQYGNVQVPNVGIEGQPLQPVAATNVASAADFVNEAEGLKTKVRAGEGTGLFAGALGENDVRNKINEGAETLITLQGIDPKSPEAADIRKNYGTYPNMSQAKMLDRIDALAAKLKSAHAAVSTGRNPAAVPGSTAEPEQPAPAPAPAPGGGAVAMPDKPEDLKVGQKYQEGDRSLTFKGIKPGTNWDDPANWE